MPRRYDVQPRKPGLVLQRDLSEAIDFTLPDGQQILLTVVGMTAKGVRLHCCAPREIKILRHELTNTAA